MRSTEFKLRGKLLVIALMAAALLVSAAAPTSFASGHEEHHTWFVTVGVQTPDGTFSGMAFAPLAIYVKQGDTIVWTVGSQEIHTVAFGTPPTDPDAANEGAEGITNPIANAFEELIEQFATPAGGTSFDGKSFYNSGVMTTRPAASGFPHAIQRYALTIKAPVGTYPFYCLVHGRMMTQVVHVIPSTEEYPFTQRQYNQQAEELREKIFAQAEEAREQTLKGLPRNVVYAGEKVTIGLSDVMCSVPRKLDRPIR